MAYEYATDAVSTHDRVESTTPVVSRRAMAAGTAWAAPAIALAAAAPAAAVSAVDTGINGWMMVYYHPRVYSRAPGCISSGRLHFHGPSRGVTDTGEEYGLWVADATRDTVVSNPVLTFYVDEASMQRQDIYFSGRSDSWNRPVAAGRVTHEGRSYRVYTSTYDGGYTYDEKTNRMYLDGSYDWYLGFDNTGSGTCERYMRTGLRRDVDIQTRPGAETVHKTFTRWRDQYDLRSEEGETTGSSTVRGR